MPSKYPLVYSSWDDQEIEAAIRVLRSGNLTMGEEVKLFEEQFALFHRARYAVMFNSGSSANLAMIAALHYNSRLNRDDEIIVPALGWSTTYAPLQQFGLKMRFVDIDSNTYTMRGAAVEEAITDKTKAVMFVGVLGTIAYLDEVAEVCKRRGLLLISDQCETMGAYVHTGESVLGEMSSFSTFYSHHICTMEGGLVVTNNPQLYNLLRLVREHGWSRAIEPPETIDWATRYRFLLPGYNLRPSEIAGAVGQVQLDKFDVFRSCRVRNHAYLEASLAASGLAEKYHLQHQPFGSCPFAMALRIKHPVQFSRDDIVQRLEQKGIETRPIIAGNILEHPVAKYFSYTTAGQTPIINKVHDYGFYVGNCGQDLTEEIDWLVKNL